MTGQDERRRNHAAYAASKDRLAQQYAAGRFLAFAGGEIVADAADFDTLRSRLLAQGRDPAQTLIVQAGVDYPEEAIIF